MRRRDFWIRGRFVGELLDAGDFLQLPEHLGAAHFSRDFAELSLILEQFADLGLSIAGSVIQSPNDI